jgi:Flp pilus assembly protein TadD
MVSPFGVALFGLGLLLLPPAQDAPAAAARAVALHRAGDLEGAVKAYGQALVLDPRNAELHSNLGAALAALGQYDDAIRSYREALDLAPGDPRIRLNLALAYYKSGEIPRAAQELEALHAGQPEDLRTTLLLADCRLQLGDYAAVEALLRPVEAARPDDRGVLYMLGMALVRGGKPEEGQTRVEKLMRGGDSAEASYLFGSAAFARGDYPRATQELKKALALNPKMPLLRSYYGRSLLFSGDPEGAEGAFREELAEAPNDYEATFFLASILSRRGRRAEARPLIERALQLRPHSDEARALLASLDHPESNARAAGEVSPLVGQLAPDVELRRPDSGGSYPLSSLRGRPVLLVFGSLTCPQFRHGTPVLNRLYERFAKQVAFRLVYIREAHPEGEAWQSTINERDGVSLPEARSEEERSAHAAACRRRLKVPFEAVLDRMDGRAEAAFAAFPSQAFVIDRTGKVTFATALDEGSLRPEALEAALTATVR